MTEPDDHAAARQSLLLGNMPAPIVERLLAMAPRRRFSRGEALFHRGDAADAIHVLLDGWVKLYRVGANGNEAVVNVLSRGHSFGEAVALRGMAYPVSAEAVSDCRVLQIPARDLAAMMRAEPEVCLAALASTLQHLHQLVGQVEQIKAQTGAQRVAEFLLELCGCDAGRCSVTLPYDKTLIAGRLGMKPESLSRAFARLKPLGVSITRNHATIENVAALSDYCEEAPVAACARTV